MSNLVKKFIFYFGDPPELELILYLSQGQSWLFLAISGDFWLFLKSVVFKNDEIKVLPILPMGRPISFEVGSIFGQ